MEQKPNQKAERVLGLVEPGRRDAMRKMLAAAYAAPVIGSFSLDAMAAPISFSCVAANQGGAENIIFAGKMDCDGWRLDRSVPNGVAEHVHLEFTDVTVRLLDGPTGGMGFISNGASDLLPDAPPFVTISFAGFPDKKDERTGFAVTDCAVLNFFETGQWKRTTDKNGKEQLKGDSFVLVNSLSPVNGVTYTLKCHYDLDEVGLG